VYAKKDTIGAVDTMTGTDFYWSSSEGTLPTNAHVIDFTDGGTELRFRSGSATEANVRSIRRFK
jgi:hypothetical protein